MSFTPHDCKDMTDLYICENGGCCGQACIAVAQRITIAEVFKRWKMHRIEWKGHTTIKQFREYMDKEGFVTRLITKKNKSNMKAPFYFIRIQWIGEGENKEKPFYGWNHWTTASANTHFVLMDGYLKFFCNENGWFNSMDEYLEDNEPKGVITSMYEIKYKKLSDSDKVL